MIQLNFFFVDFQEEIDSHSSSRNELNSIMTDQGIQYARKIPIYKPKVTFSPYHLQVNANTPAIPSCVLCQQVI